MMDSSIFPLVNYNCMATCVSVHGVNWNIYSKRKEKNEIEIQRECVSERMRITADTIQFVQPFRNILLSFNQKEKAHSPLNCVFSPANTCIYTHRVQECLRCAIHNN